MCMHRVPCRGRFKLGAPRPQTQPLGRLNNLHRLKLAVKQQQLQRARSKRRKQWQKEALESIPCSSRAVWVVRARRVSLARSFCSCSPRQRIRLLITSSARAGALFVWFMELKASSVRRDAKQYNNIGQTASLSLSCLSSNRISAGISRGWCFGSDCSMLKIEISLQSSRHSKSDARDLQN